MAPTVSSNNAKDFVNSNLIGRYFDEITADMEDALGIAARQLSSGTMKHCSSSSVSTYRKDKGYLDKSSKSFYDAYASVRQGKVLDLKKLK